MLLVDDQEKALEVYKKYGKKYRERRAEFGAATNRYFPGLFDIRKSTKVEWLKIEEAELDDNDLKTDKETGIVVD